MEDGRAVSRSETVGWKRVVKAATDSRAILRTACLNFNGPLDLTIEDLDRC
jgi:hypothetical protein